MLREYVDHETCGREAGVRGLRMTVTMVVVVQDALRHIEHGRLDMGGATENKHGLTPGRTRENTGREGKTTERMMPSNYY